MFKTINIGPLSHETLADFPRFLKEEIPGLVEQGYEGDMPSMKVGAKHPAGRSWGRNMGTTMGEHGNKLPSVNLT